MLAEFDAPATVYLTTYYVARSGLPVPNVMVPYLLWQARGLAAVDLSSHGAFTEATDLTSESGRALATRRIVEARAGDTTDGKDRRLDALAETLGLDMPAIRLRRHLQLMTPDEVRDLPRGLVDVELHTHRHRTPDDEASFRRELAENAAMIGDLTGRAPRHFCYPSGRYRHAFLPWLRDAGVLSATTCVTGIAAPNTEPLLTPRLVDTSHTPDATFAGWVTGAAAILPQRPATLMD
ncbi:MAG: polysaccharide deacetylase family protein [Gemmatimonadetes bacterium]|nr:polysaccharide deacetylase family protein [Gemmatimonadota bacterium]